MPTTDDQNLLCGCLAGDPAAQEAFVRQFSNLVYATIQGAARAKSALFAPHDLEDLHNSLFMSLFDKQGHKLRQFQGKNGCSLASWIRTITVRMVLDHLRRSGDVLDRPERTVPVDELLGLPASQAHPEHQLAAKERIHLVQAAMGDLPARDQLVLRLLYFEEHDLSAVARMLNIPATNIHSVKHRAIQRLKAAVAKRSGS